MRRRNFLQLAAASGLGLSIPISIGRARAAEGGYPGPFFVFVNAGGAWDPRFHFDPTLDVTQNRLYTSVAQVGNISYAPIGVDLEALGLDPGYGYETLLVGNKTFLDRHGAKLTVINGVDMQTNNHDAGTRAIWSGNLSEGYPSIGALIAAAKAGDRPMAYLSAGGYDATNGLVPLTRVGSADDMQKLAFPNRVDPNNDENLEQYHAGETFGRIQAAQVERLNALLEKEYLPRAQRSLSELQLARTRVSDLQALTLPDELVTLEGYQLGGLQNNMRQAQIAVAAFQAGLAACVNLDIGGFDTHGNHDRDQPARLVQLLTLIDFVVAQVEAAGLADRTTIFVGSDFARGPFYNSEYDNAGKDHWPIGSFWALGAGIAGNRVIGATTDDQRARNVDPSSLAVVDSGGVTITVERIHHAIRAFAGVADFAKDYPLKSSALPLFG